MTVRTIINININNINNGLNTIGMIQNIYRVIQDFKAAFLCFRCECEIRTNVYKNSVLIFFGNRNTYTYRCRACLINLAELSVSMYIKYA